MHFSKGFADAFQHVSGLSLRYLLLFFDEGVEVSALHKLHDQDKAVLLLNDFVEADDPGMDHFTQNHDLVLYHQLHSTYLGSGAYHEFRLMLAVFEGFFEVSFGCKIVIDVVAMDLKNLS